jgi:hypothetical protein
MIESDGHSDAENQRDLFRRLWKRAKSEDYRGLGGEQLRIAQALRLHADTFGSFFDAYEEGARETVDMNGEEVRPEIHISLHAIIEGQLEAEDPAEVRPFFQTMRRKGVPRHDAIHLIGSILMPLVAESLRRMTPFDENRYARMLRRCRSLEPEQILDRLDEILEEGENPSALDKMFAEAEGTCRHCGAEGPVNETGFCEDCGDKFERDMLRLRLWEKSLTASFLEPESYERLRLDTMEQFGKDFELLTGTEGKRWTRKVRPRRSSDPLSSSNTGEEKND